MDLGNLTEKEYLEVKLGLQYLPLTVVVPLSILYGTILLSGVIGNAATCIVIVRNSSMHTPTYYYLFSLAISDLALLTLGLPFEMATFWKQYPSVLGETACKIRDYACEMSSYASVLTIMAFSMERYLAICHPLSLYTMSGFKRSVSFIVAAWSIALLAAIPFAKYTVLHFEDFPPGSGNRSDESAICMMLSENTNFLYVVSSGVFFIVPMVVIAVVYTRMGLNIRRSTKNSLGPLGESMVYRDTRQVQSRKVVVRMLGAVVVMFFLCWAPFHTQRLLYVYSQNCCHVFAEVLYISSGCLYYFSATVNPILYNLMSARYREAFKKTLCCRNRRSRGDQSSSTKMVTMCQCDSKEGGEKIGHAPTLRCSIRLTIDQAKEMLRGSTREDKERAMDDLPRRRHFLSPKNNCATEPLLGVKVPVTPQLSNASSTSRNNYDESASTASSGL